VSIRDWVAGKIKDDFDVEPRGELGLVVKREGRPNAHVYCADANEHVLYSAEEFERAILEFPELEFVVLIKRDADHEVYERAGKIGVAIHSFGELSQALSASNDISHWETRDQAYLRRRMSYARSVESFEIKGRSAYLISRRGMLSSLVVAFIEPYELTSDDIYGIAEDYRHLKLDAIVVTNPYARGFAPEPMAAARAMGIRLRTLNDFVSDLGSEQV